MVGIDKILISTPDYAVKDLTNRDVWGANINYKPGSGALPLYSDYSGNQIEANNFYHNGKKATYDINQRGLSITFNPSKAYHPYNLTTTGDDLNRYVDEVVKELNTIGLRANIDTMKLNRVDVAQNNSMSFPVNVYQNGLRYLKGKRQESREAPNGYYVSNKQHQAIFYDKEAELLSRDIIGITPPNFMRVEARLVKHKSVIRHIHADTLHALLNTSAPDINQHYKSYLNNVIFSRSKIGEQLILDFYNETKFYNDLKAQKPKGYFNYWLQVNSIDALLDMFGSIACIEAFIYEAEQNRMTAYRNVQKVKELIATKELISTSRNEITPTSLLNEIRVKFAA